MRQQMKQFLQHMLDMMRVSLGIFLFMWGAVCFIGWEMVVPEWIIIRVLSFIGLTLSICYALIRVLAQE